jgi:hypothetical protein
MLFLNLINFKESGYGKHHPHAKISCRTISVFGILVVHRVHFEIATEI